MPVEQLLPAAYRERVEAGVALLAREAGLVLRRPARLANSRLALQAAEFARDAGAFEAAHVALFRAHWEEGRDLGIDAIPAHVAGPSWCWVRSRTRSSKSSCDAWGPAAAVGYPTKTR